MPRTTNPTLAMFMSGQDDQNGNRNFRITHQSDIVPNLIPTANTGKTVLYQHITPSYFITTNNIQIPTAKDMIVVPNDVNISMTTLDVVGAHRMYFNSISACSAKTTFTTTSVAQFERKMGFTNTTPIPA
jgi:hypothetical protein